MAHAVLRIDVGVPSCFEIRLPVCETPSSAGRILSILAAPDEQKFLSVLRPVLTGCLENTGSVKDTESSRLPSPLRPAIPYASRLPTTRVLSEVVSQAYRSAKKTANGGNC